MSKGSVRVLQVNKLYSPWIGGIETVAEDVAEYLKGKEGIVITNLVCQARGNRTVDSVNGVRTYRAASWGILSGMPLSMDFFFLFRRLAREADVIILHHPFPLAFIAYRYFGLGRKVVVWYHSDIVKQTLLKIPFMPSIRFALKRAASVIVSNAAIAKQSPILRSVSDRCKVVYFGVDDGELTATPDVEKKAKLLRGQYGTPLVLSVGRLVYYKGYEYLIDAMRDVPEVNLLIIGKGKLRGELEDRIKSKGLTGRVHIIDPVDDLAPYYHACDVFALPSSESSEVFGIVQIEAMACGKPVVNTALPTGVPEVSLDGKTGRTVPPKNALALAAALREILSDCNEYHRLSRNALNEVAERFTKQRFFANLDVALDSKSVLS
jgi:glycosyltransferase involved in cell wall biosynthesis